MKTLALFLSVFLFLSVGLVISAQNDATSTARTTASKPTTTLRTFNTQRTTTTTLNLGAMIQGEWYWQWTAEPSYYFRKSLGEETWLSVFNDGGGFSEWEYTIDSDATGDGSYRGLWTLDSRKLTIELSTNMFRIRAFYALKEIDATSMILRYTGHAKGTRSSLVMYTEFGLVRRGWSDSTKAVTITQ